jgi:hypothetical protein
MALLSYRRHRFTPPIIQQAIWLYLRFTLSYRDVEELLAARGLDISYETVRRWVLNGPRPAVRSPLQRPLLRSPVTCGSSGSACAGRSPAMPARRLCRTAP